MASSSLRKETLAHQDSALLNFAKAIGHHGLVNFMESVRQRYHMKLTEAYARDLLSRAGYPVS